MTDDIINDLHNACIADTNPWDITLYERAISEIKLLRAELQRSALQTNVMKNIALGPYGNAADEIELLLADSVKCGHLLGSANAEIDRLKEELKSCNEDFDTLTELFNNMRQQRNRWKLVAWLGHKVIFSKWEYTQFEQAYEEAIDGE